MKTTQDILRDAKRASKTASLLTTEKKNRVLMKMAEQLEKQTADILQANAIDLQNAKGVLPDVMLDRLRLDEKRIKGMADGIREVVNLPDPVGEILEKTTLPYSNGRSTSLKRPLSAAANTRR